MAISTPAPMPPGGRRWRTASRCMARVPISCRIIARPTRAIHTHLVPAGAFRGFGVPQSALAQEQLYDEIAEKLGLDPLEFRLRNALTPDQPTVCGQVLGAGLGYKECLVALAPHWKRARAEAEAFNASGISRFRRGAGIAGMWYGCGNTSMANPSTIRLGLKPDGRLALHQGAVDIGPGFQHRRHADLRRCSGCADRSVRSPECRYRPDARLRQDLGPRGRPSSPARPRFLSGKKLRQEILRIANAGDDARLVFGDGTIGIEEQGAEPRARSRPPAGAMPAAMCCRRKRASIRRPRRSTRTGRARPMRSMAPARISPRSRSIPISGWCGC